ncbi:DUF4123 domain-containing protein [uncultured Litoreibacter sp.]|uniref:DUF4123 domain-containing protein n=1 Tax=uncultured Litoreibacter sp. TaxID=1392394 RepID=UPI002635B652|nr:DUF4123 domain-containing protein [uncultured Litoreibacter sp.]
MGDCIKTDLEDCWTQQFGAPIVPPEQNLSIEVIEDVEPLDAQFGVMSPKIVPDALRGPLFGQPRPANADLQQAESDKPSGLPKQTYAILDAAKVPGLPELLLASGLEHRCLFVGAAQNDLADVAPWIVRLEDSSSFTRNLFTRSEATWHIWDNEPGIYLRSRGSFDDIWGHFRKFTKVTDANGKPLFFRFWDTVTARIYFSGICANPTRVEQFFRLPSGPSIELIVTDPVQNTLHLRPPVVRNSKRVSRNVIFEEDDHRLMREVSYSALSNEIALWLPLEYQDQFNGVSKTKLASIAQHVVSVGRAFNLTMKEDFSYLAQMMMTMGGWCFQDGIPIAVLNILKDSNATKAKRLADVFSSAHETTPQAELLRQWPEVRDHLAGIPPDHQMTPDQFNAFRARFFASQTPNLSAVLSGTRTRLQELGLSDQQQEGKAIVLSLILGPRFFEDPFKPWAQLPAEQAIDAAWNSTLGSN